MIAMWIEDEEFAWSVGEECVYCHVLVKHCRCAEALAKSLLDRGFTITAVDGRFITFSTSNNPPEHLTLSTTDNETDCYEVVEEISEDQVSAERVVAVTKGLWDEENVHETFMEEVQRWLYKKPGNHDDELGEAMVKYAELLISHPIDSFETVKDARAFYMQSIKNNRIDLDRKSKSFGKGKVAVMSLDTSEDENEVGYYDTYSFEYEVEYTENQKKTIQEVYEWDQKGRESTLSKDDRKLYMRMNKLPVAEVESKEVVFVNSSKAIDLRDDEYTQKALSSEVVVRTMTQFERLKAKANKTRSVILKVIDDTPEQSIISNDEKEVPNVQVETRPVVEDFTDEDGYVDYPAFRQAVKEWGRNEPELVFSFSDEEPNW